ncbi:MAG: hypothetical protein IK115_07225 [Lachnospiraceae bacterium]|nr:hypothetical protein [Lachnospiraceae bacterium]
MKFKEKSLRSLLSWILILAMCLTEAVQPLSVLAGDEDAVEITAEDAEEAPDALVSEDAADDEAAVTEENGEDEAVLPAEEEENVPEEEAESASEDEAEVPAEETEEPGEADGAENYKIKIKVKYGQTEARNLVASANLIRADKKIPALALDYGLEKAAKLRAAELAMCYSETRPNGYDYDDSSKGILAPTVQKGHVREIKYIGQNKASDLFQSLSSNELIYKNTDYKRIGVGHVRFDGEDFWAILLTADPYGTQTDSGKPDDYQTVEIDVTSNVINAWGLYSTPDSGSKVNLEYNEETDLPKITARLRVKEHRPNANNMFNIENPPTVNWTLSKTDFATITNNNSDKKQTIKAKVASGNSAGTAKAKLMGSQETTFNYTFHVVVHPSKVVLDTPSDGTKLNLDESLVLKAHVEPAWADDTAVVFKSSNENVIRISGTNQPKVTGVGVGTALLTVEPKDTYLRRKDANTYPLKAQVSMNVVAERSVAFPKLLPEEVENTGNVGRGQALSFSCDTPDARIYYHTSVSFDSTISENSLKTIGKLYTEPFTISENVYIYYTAWKTFSDGTELCAGIATRLLTYKGNEWGDVVSGDRVNWGSEIPTGLWVAKASIPQDLTYTGKAHKPTCFRVYDGTKLLTYKKDYTISYKNNKNVSTQALAIFKFKKNYKDKITVEFPISPTDITGVVCSAVNKSSGLKITLVVNGVKLKQNRDFSYTMSDGKAVITGQGNYCGTTSCVPDSGAKLKSVKKDALIAPIGPFFYNGMPQTPEVRITEKGSSTELVAGVDYTLSYAKNLNVGTAKVTIRGCEQSGWTGSVTKSFKIQKVEITTFVPEYDDQIYYRKGGAKVSIISFKSGMDTYYLTEGVDYTISYKNNKKTSSYDVDESDSRVYKNDASFVVKGKGNFKGQTIRYTFAVQATPLYYLNVTAEDREYSDKPGNYKTKFSITDWSGKKLKSGTDYDPKLTTYRYNEDCTVYNNKVGNVQRKVGEAVQPGDIIPIPKDKQCITLQVGLYGKGNYCNAAHALFKITRKSIAKMKVKIADREYTGLPVTVTKNDIVFTKDSVTAEDYDIVSYTNNTEVGTATVLLRGKGNYGGYKTVKFKIKKKPALLRIMSKG